MSHFDHDGSGRLDVQEVNATITLFNSLDHSEHINGGKCKVPLGDQPPMQLCTAGHDGKIAKEELARVMKAFAEGPLATTVPHVIHIFQELCEIEWVFVMWAGSKSGTLTTQEVSGVLGYFNKWCTNRHDPTLDGLMTMTHYNVQQYGSEINFASFARWIWGELSCLEEAFSEPFELTLGKLSECAEQYKTGSEPQDYNRRSKSKERCPWSGTLLPPRTIAAWLANFKKDAKGRFDVEEINTAISLFNSLDHLEHLFFLYPHGDGGQLEELMTRRASFVEGGQRKVALCSAGPDGKVGQDDIMAVLQAFCTNALGDSQRTALAHVIHVFQELNEIEWLFRMWAGDTQSNLDKTQVAFALKNFNKWALKRHTLDPASGAGEIMTMNICDVSIYGPDIDLKVFTRWVWEELSTMEEMFSEPFEVMLQIWTDCMQAAKVISCFREWDTAGLKTIDYNALITVLSDVIGDEIDPGVVQEVLDKSDLQRDGRVDYTTFVEAIMLRHL